MLHLANNFGEEGFRFNALWPRTLILNNAVKNFVADNKEFE